MSDKGREKPPCAVCRGGYDEHFDNEGKPITQHAYTEHEGDLVTHDQARKRAESPAKQQLPQGMVMTMGANPLATQRLVEVLIEKNMISVEEALYIGGFGAKPNPSPSFADPATIAEVPR